ncbi:MAG: TetR/AcrR family transcriptional regulator [Chrysiogenales bacterium]|nr:MAG: TetR/AcrR family transcriptional regulator [Chrysiogenales bacterium]
MKDRKSARTKETIVRAARKIFSEHAYHTASIRMIGKEAGIEHPLINYYFPSKAELFDAIIREICEEFAASAGEWFDAIREREITEGFTEFIELLMEFNRHNPEPLRILALNLTQTKDFSLIPGYHRFPDLISRLHTLYVEKIKPMGPDQEIRMFLHSFYFLIISFLGAGPCIAQVQGMDPDGEPYREWMKATLLFIFLPRLKDINLPRAAAREDG